jgi:ABC-2 type transport system ATP-binding protein
VVAVDDLSFEVPPGTITGFLGPNGSGKTTTMRLLLGLAAPTEGHTLVLGQPYATLENPARRVGALLEITGFHPGRTGRNHLRVAALQGGLDASRVDEVLERVGLIQDARRRVGGYSLGMRQRLGFATALLGDPEVLVLDEPANGLDPAGVAWLRGFLREYADSGRTVLISSHVLGEVAQVADRLVVIDRGRLVAEGSVADITGGGPGRLRVRVRVAQAGAERLLGALRTAGGEVVARSGGSLTVSHLPAARVGEIALAAGVALSELRPDETSLEEAFLELTGKGGSTAAGGIALPPPPPPPGGAQ